MRRKILSKVELATKLSVGRHTISRWIKEYDEDHAVKFDIYDFSLLYSFLAWVKRVKGKTIKIPN